MMKNLKDSFDEVFGDKQKVLVVTAHPDDNEVICGGIVARLIKAGKKIRLVVTTNGEKGNEDKDIAPEELAETRALEQRSAAQILGISPKECFNLGIPDGELETSVENIGKIVHHIREFKPDIVITHCPDEVINIFSSKDGVRWVNHRDHRHTGIIATDAVYPYSRDKNFFPEQLKSGVTPHAVTEIMYSDGYEHLDRLYFNVTDFIDQKLQALKACPSVIDPDHARGYIDETKIGDQYYEILRYYKDL